MAAILWRVVMGDAFSWLQTWFFVHCDGDWEHGYGVRIGTLDNPGWSVRVDLEGTELEGRAFQDFERHTTEEDWVVCRVRGTMFEGFGGPHNLPELLERFRDWAEGVGRLAIRDA